MNIKGLNQKKDVKIGIFTDSLIYECDSAVIIRKINDLVATRIAWKITQQDMADCLKVSLRTIQRWEKLQVDSLTIYLNYKQIFT
jgi:DNA-binding XRE family transcriptional regulator